MIVSLIMFCFFSMQRRTIHHEHISSLVSLIEDDQVTDSRPDCARFSQLLLAIRVCLYRLTNCVRLCLKFQQGFVFFFFVEGKRCHKL